MLEEGSFHLSTNPHTIQDYLEAQECLLEPKEKLIVLGYSLEKPLVGIGTKAGTGVFMPNTKMNKH